MKENGIYIKSAGIAAQSVSADDLAMINQYALKELSADEVFCFKLAMCDNQVDRDDECFSDEALDDMAKMFVGKTVITNHERKTENQCARIYKCEVVTNELIKQLVGYCYTVRSDENKNLIVSLEAGIRKECSIGFYCCSAKCSICGVDNAEKYCQHFPGREYDGKKCYFILGKITDAYEVSLVPVPAQPRAGTIKSYGDTPMRKNVEESTDPPHSQETEKEQLNSVELAIADTDAFLLLEENNV